MPTLAQRIGTSTHLSPLLQKARSLGVNDSRDLESIAIARGLRYFGLPDNPKDESTENRKIPAMDLALFTNE